MAVQVYADSALVYDTRLEDYGLLGLKTTSGLNKGGTAEIIMPPNHPAYNAFISFKTVVTLYDGGALRFRGRALYPSEDFYNTRTITCEGERCFLRDYYIRPYLYQDAPATIFSQALDLYNAQADPFKRFSLGEITVTDANDYIRLESSTPETFADFFTKMVDRCGGYITFTDDGEGGRAINWLANLTTQSNQAIEFGENLLEFARSGESPDLATAILPYGAQLDDGTRVTIESVTEDGADWIQDDEAVALRGRIMAFETWDDVTDPANLLTKAKKWLASHKMAVTSLQLTAADLHRLDKNIDSFHVGDRVRVISKPHGLNDWLQLTERTTDWLDPAGGNITLGQTVASLTGSDVLSEQTTNKNIGKATSNAIANYRINVAAAIQEATESMTTLIDQTAESIMAEVSATYSSGEDVTSLVETRIAQLADSVTITFEQLQTQVEEIDGETRTTFETWEKYIRFEDGDILLGESGNEITLRIENDIIRFLDGGAEVAYISNKKLFITDAHFLNSLRVGSFIFLPRKNGNLSLLKAGD